MNEQVSMAIISFKLSLSYRSLYPVLSFLTYICFLLSLIRLPWFGLSMTFLSTAGLAGAATIVSFSCRATMIKKTISCSMDHPVAEVCGHHSVVWKDTTYSSVVLMQACRSRNRAAQQYTIDSIHDRVATCVCCFLIDGAWYVPAA